MMITGYAKQGDMEAARQLFDDVPRRDVVTWNAMIAGYVSGGDNAAALVMFGEMRRAEEIPDEVTMLSLLSACSELGDLDVGERIRGCGIESGSGGLNSGDDSYGSSNTYGQSGGQGQGGTGRNFT